MIARQVDDARALARLAQQLLHDVVVVLRPVPARAQLPAVDDIADQIDRVGVVIAQEIEKLLGLAAARAEMHIGNKQSTELYCAVLECHRIIFSHLFDSESFINAFHCRTMTAIVNAAASSRTVVNESQLCHAARINVAGDDSADLTAPILAVAAFCIAVTVVQLASIAIAICRFRRSARRAPLSEPLSSGQPGAPAMRNRQLCRRYAALRRSSSIIRITKSCSASRPQRTPSSRSSKA